MKVALLTNIVSPHQLPLAEEIVKLVGEDNYRYAYTEAFHEERAKMGWDNGRAPVWCRPANECRDFLEDADLVYSELRDFDLFKTRLANGRKTFYVSERWLKPVLLPFGLSLPGWIKLLHPGYIKKAKQVADLFGCYGFCYLPQGPWAAKDMRLMCKVLGKRIDDSQLIPWGYFVAPSKDDACAFACDASSKETLKVLWVGRMIGWKRVDTIIKAVRYLNGQCNRAAVELTLVGSGCKKRFLENLAGKDAHIRFVDSVPIARIREFMRSNDVYVLSSNVSEGWGAALSEALEEGMLALGTYEAGASAAILPTTHLFHAGDWRGLAKLLRRVVNGELKPTGIGEWSAKSAARRLLELAK